MLRSTAVPAPLIVTRVAESITSFTTALSNGDAEAVEKFYRQYFDALYAHARRSTRRDESFCLDIVQESVLRVLRAVRPARSEAQFAGWLRLVVQTTAYDLLRRESRREKREAAYAAMSQAAVDDSEVAADQEQLDWLSRQISKMDAGIVQMIELRFQHRWTLARIAETFGLTAGTIDGRLRRALADLRDQAREAWNE